MPYKFVIAAASFLCGAVVGYFVCKKRNETVEDDDFEFDFDEDEIADDEYVHRNIFDGGYTVDPNHLEIFPSEVMSDYNNIVNIYSSDMDDEEDCVADCNIYIDPENLGETDNRVCSIYYDAVNDILIGDEDLKEMVGTDFNKHFEDDSVCIRNNHYGIDCEIILTEAADGQESY